MFTLDGTVFVTFMTTKTFIIMKETLPLVVLCSIHEVAKK